MGAVTQTADPVAAEYQALLRWYPTRWRMLNESAALGMLLDDAESRGIKSLGASDRRAIVLAGLRERLVPFERVSPLNHAALLAGVLFSFVYALVIWSPGVHMPGSIGPFVNPSVLTGALVAMSWILAALHAGRTSRVVSWSAFAANALIAIAAVRWHWYGPSLWAAAMFAVVTLLGGIQFRRSRR